MAKEKLILHDGSEVEMEAGASLGALQVFSQNRLEMIRTWGLLTPEHLETVQIKNGDGLVVGNYTDLVLVSETSTVASDGQVLTTYCLREKTELERLAERVDANTETLGIHDGAIGDVAAVVSTIAAAQEGGVQ